MSQKTKFGEIHFFGARIRHLRDRGNTTPQIIHKLNSEFFCPSHEGKQGDIRVEYPGYNDKGEIVQKIASFR